jgi:hypothetical protein
MNLLLDSFWRAAAYCLHPRVILLSILPLLLMVAMALGLGYFFWVPALDAVSSAIASWHLMATVIEWLDTVGFSGLKAAIAPLIVVFLSTPVIVVVALLFVATMMTPAIVKLVANRRFAALRREQGGSFVGGALGALAATLLALVVLALSIPLWFIPPLVLIVPPLIWGWLTYRVMSFDALSEHASGEERLLVLREHRHRLLVMGIATGYLGAAPSVVWASGAMFAVAFPILIPVAIWIYTLVFAFSSLWFTHYCLAALQQLRAAPAGVPPEPALIPG